MGAGSYKSLSRLETRDGTRESKKKEEKGPGACTREHGMTVKIGRKIRGYF